MTRLEFQAAIQKAFPHLPAPEAARIADDARAAQRTHEFVSGLVGIYARHNYTDYETQLGGKYDEFVRRSARRQTTEQLNAVMAYWRTGQGDKPARRQIAPNPRRAAAAVIAPKPLPDNPSDCSSRSQLVKFLSQKYGGWKPQEWTAEEMSLYENFPKPPRNKNRGFCLQRGVSQGSFEALCQSLPPSPGSGLL
jgi:hypothetical protein